jgi:hypothetical protein
LAQGITTRKPRKTSTKNPKCIFSRGRERKRERTEERGNRGREEILNFSCVQNKNNRKRYKSNIFIDNINAALAEIAQAPCAATIEEINLTGYDGIRDEVKEN